jgi:hypothetical protein
MLLVVSRWFDYDSRDDKYKKAGNAPIQEATAGI